MELIALEQHLADEEFFIKFHIYISYFYYYSCILFIAKASHQSCESATKGRC